MPDQYLTYQKFTDKTDAEELASLLGRNGIDFLLEDDSAPSDPLTNTGNTKEFSVKLKQADFEKADHIQLELSVELADVADKDHYLFGFTDAELMEIIARRDEWSKFDFLLAQKILKDRGHSIDNSMLDELQEQRIQELAKPESRQMRMIITGYVLALLGGFLGIFIGWYLATHRKTLPNGHRVYGYLPEDRRHGNRIVILGLICLVFWIIIGILAL